jgi:hypothetical protein
MPVNDGDSAVPCAFAGSVDGITLTIEAPKPLPANEKRLTEAERISRA